MSYLTGMSQEEPRSFKRQAILTALFCCSLALAWAVYYQLSIPKVPSRLAAAESPPVDLSLPGRISMRSTAPGDVGLIRSVKFDGARPLDFIGEWRVTDAKMPIRTGVDEAPTVRIDRTKTVGGNHLAEDYSGELSVSADGVVTAVEQYSVPDASISITWDFPPDGRVLMDYTISPERPMHVIVNLPQVWRPTLGEGETLYIASGDWCKDITTPAKDMLPQGIIWPFSLVVVSEDGTEKRRLTINFAHKDRGRPSMSFYISPAGKLYPRAYEGDISGPLTLHGSMTWDWRHAGDAAPECD